MSYKRKIITWDEAKELAGRFPQMLVHMMSEVILGETSTSLINWEELIDARFFSKEAELHLFTCEGEPAAVLIEDDGDNQDTITKTYKLAARFRESGEGLEVKEYLAEDEDGQVYVEQTRLCGITGGKRNGKEE